ncbi:hypothetical protein FRACYDRAFT_250197 [Fragilariopsis cylindrus CCMP1102]|uniref:Uncharacterized protein n=1 Tax=Fragilariopsis cylindrus CCMP1102 TaxID=635003 RepID=A0A1E7EQ97_9STRA|nr:hypothetical protein FRACYDRAFT_250197 [Fragilariopsis cylindrus CCMP1102]|eukprot:OEU07977.1 hypothetical protein FRACYDRAFT_250197 [Fragilariopsis cylindrus CCMP1102]
MAGAAAKKAAAAKQATAKIYIPILVLSNILYVVVMFGTSDSIPYDGTKFGLFGMVITWLLQAYSYMGILESCAIPATTATNKKNKKDLAGGSNLDLFVATIGTQFLSVLHSPRWFYITILGVPIIGVYQLYSTFYPSTAAIMNNNNKNKDNKEDNNKEVDPILTEKRKRRADKRKQKWS